MIGGEHSHLQNIEPIVQINTKLSYPGSSFCSMLGSDSSTTNYPGKIPDGLDLPSDVATEKHPNILKKFLAYFLSRIYNFLKPYIF